MKYGIYYAYWEKEWGGNFVPYIRRVKELGFDILEVACGNFHLESDGFFHELKKVADENGIMLTGGYGPRPEHNPATKEPAALQKTFDFYADVFRKMDIAGIRSIGGALYSYWPVDFSLPMDKEGDFARSVAAMQHLADMAADYGITLNMEVLNRFEGYLLNVCSEALEYVKAVDRKNVMIMLDTFHMNIEEDSFVDAIKLAGGLLGHFHIGEANRRPPYPAGRMPWVQIGKALHDIGYSGNVVMEPFVTMGGQVGKDISIWRNLSTGSEDELDKDARNAVAFIRGLWG
jgi:D-psicose/D-tagatose/L-ribulose 3-epimerase